ncbi:hypothetical protein FDP22_07595 [Paroceanicella profunda]|uniref:Lipoprotein n=1 Tax=Paroceanicella profunda TaxID=2579971 RepID=A0A5B8FZH7_9RHOB|nr:hypothetical protein [Paroceanicella profunda]QDL91663.1 hypothetical protein FDP22_07595 [Paroceanicella profunda]
MKRSLPALLLPVILIGCGPFDNPKNAYERRANRTYLMNSSGPKLNATKYGNSIDELRKYGPQYTPGTTPPPLKADQLLPTRAAIFAQVDADCDAYIDAIFWANRSKDGLGEAIGLAGAATTTVLSVTGAAATAIAVTATAFGLGAGITDSYYNTFLYQLEPSGVVGIIEKARLAYITSVYQTNPTSEGMLLAQVQGYIRQCTPPKIEALVNAAIKEGRVVPRPTEKPDKPLSKAERDRLTELMAKDNRTTLEDNEMANLFRRLITAGVMTDAEEKAAGAGGLPASPSTGSVVPMTMIAPAAGL